MHDKTITWCAAIMWLSLALPCCAAGCFTATIALPCLAHVFEEEDALDRLEAFVSLNGPTHYGLSPNDETVALTRVAPYSAPSRVARGDVSVELFDPGHPLHWSLS